MNHPILKKMISNENNKEVSEFFEKNISFKKNQMKLDPKMFSLFLEVSKLMKVKGSGSKKNRIKKKIVTKTINKLLEQFLEHKKEMNRITEDKLQMYSYGIEDDLLL